MPIIAGQPFYDASGNAMTDASGNAIGEPDLPVSLLGGLVVMAGENPLSGLIDTVSDLLDAITGLVNGTLTMQAIRNMQDDLNGFLLNGGPDTFSGHDPVNQQSNISAEGIVNSIPAVEIEWPVEAPAWYTDPPTIDYEQIASDVWGYTLPINYLDGQEWGPMAETALRAITEYLQLVQGFDGYAVPGNPHFRYITKDIQSGNAWVGDWTTTVIAASVPVLDLTLVQEGDTVYSFLTREYPAYDWQQDGPYNIPNAGVVWLGTSPGTYFFRCTLTDADLAVASNLTTIINNTTTIEGGNAPLWPGVANVILGEPVALTSQLHLEGELDGVVVSITTPPSGTGLRQIGGALYDYGVGEVAFETDRGDLEPWQYLGFRAAVFIPKTMERAAGVRFRVLAGAEGTVRPWLRS